MALDSHKLTLWSGRVQERLQPAWRWLHDRLLPRAADAAARLPGLFAPAVEGGDESHFLPNFCRGRAVFGIVLVAELLALVITLITRRISENLFQDLLLISLFVQCMALLSAVALCAARRFLNTLPNRRARGFAFVEYAERTLAEEAVKRFDGQLFMGRPLAVSEARARDDRGPGGPPRPGGGFAPRPPGSGFPPRPGGFTPRPPGEGGYSPRPSFRQNPGDPPLTEAAIRGKKTTLARALVQERLALRPDSRVNLAFARRAAWLADAWRD